jgi:hypothetical protein
VNHGAELVALRLGFEEGLFSRADVRAWVDREVARLPELSAALLDLTTLGGKSDRDVVELLRILEPELPAATKAHLVLGVVAALHLAERIPLSQAVSRLSSIATFEVGLSDAERSVIYELDATLDLAAEGFYSTLEEVRERTCAFLSTYQLPNMPPR